MNISHLAAGIALTVVFGSVQAATLTLFNDKTNFLAATSATPASGALPDLGFISSGSATVGSVTFNAVPGHGIFIGVAGTGLTDWTTLLAGNELAVNDTEHLDVATAAPVYSLGFEFAEPSVGGSGANTCFVPSCTDSTFNVALLSGTTLVAQFLFNAPDDLAAFVGVWSDTAFDHVEVRELAGGIDDEFYGQVYTGTVAPVPLPATLPLLGGALALLAARRRRGG